MATAETARFELTAEVPAIDTLVVGFSEYGLAGLTAVDYLVDQLEMEQIGHLVDAGSPNIAPFEAGRPRHHTRLYVDEELSIAAVVGERVVPPAMSSQIAAAVESAARTLAVESVTVAANVESHYKALAERLEAAEPETAPEDRMYM